MHAENLPALAHGLCMYKLDIYRLIYAEEHIHEHFHLWYIPSLDPSKQILTPFPNDWKFKNITNQKLTTKGPSRRFQPLQTSR